MKKVSSHVLRLLCVTLSLALLLSGTAAAAYERDPNVNDPGVTPSCIETVELTVGLASNANVIDWKTNLQTQMIEQYCNLDLTFEEYVSNEMLAKLNIQVAAGGQDLPDVILRGMADDATVYSWGLEGAILPLNDYYENSAYFLNEAVERTGVNFLEMITSPDGNIYGIPSYNQSFGNEFPAKIWLYTPWLEALGASAPTTAEELYDLLTLVKNTDLNGNGLADEVPFSGATSGNLTQWFNVLMSTFTDTGNENGYAVKDGQIYAAFATEEWREGLRYTKKLMDEGLLSPLVLTQDNDALTAQLAGEATTVFMAAGAAVSQMPAADERRAQYEGIAPFIGPDGAQRVVWRPSKANIALMISANCEHPEAAFRLGDYMVSEELSIHTRWGQAGVDWSGPAEGEVSAWAYLGYPARVKTINLIWGQPQNQHWFQTGPFIRQYAIAAGQIKSDNPLDTETKIAECAGEYIGKQNPETIKKFIFTMEENDAVSEPVMVINEYVTEARAMFIMGRMDLDKEWDAYLEELEMSGLGDVLAIYQTVYDRMYK